MIKTFGVEIRSSWAKVVIKILKVILREWQIFKNHLLNTFVLSVFQAKCFESSTCQHNLDIERWVEILNNEISTLSETSYNSMGTSPWLTSCKRSWAAMAFKTFFLLVSCISPPTSNSSKMKYAFSKLKMMSSSQTYIK